jgi:hypothetical protein
MMGISHALRRRPSNRKAIIPILLECEDDFSLLYGLAQCPGVTPRPTVADWGEKLDRQVILPSEAQGEMAARTLDERIHPWGGAGIDPNRANNVDAGIHDTIPVDAFLNGESHCGGMDMVGNVW